MFTGLYTRWDYNEGTQNFEARHNRKRTFENTILYFIATTVKLVSKQWVVFSFFPVKKLELVLLMIKSSEELKTVCFREKSILDRRSVVV